MTSTGDTAPSTDHNVGLCRDRDLISILTPAFNEAENLPLLYEQLLQALANEELDWEWVVVDDHSEDETFQVVQEISAVDPRVRGVRLARNTGSHMALLCSLHQARGSCAIALAGDLQDPPETIPDLLERWRAGAHVVWAARSESLGVSWIDRLLSRLYHFLMRSMIGIRQTPTTGADFFLVSRRVLDALQQCRETNLSVLGLISWLGFRQETIFYNKRPRGHGSSGWTLAKKIKLVVDSVVSFSYLPIRLISCLGLTVAILGFFYAAAVIINALGGNPASGWSSLMVVLLVLGGLMMLMTGVLGEYVWRGLDEARRRPQFIVEETTEAPDLRPSSSARTQGADDLPS